MLEVEPIKIIGHRGMNMRHADKLRFLTETLGKAKARKVKEKERQEDGHPRGKEREIKEEEKDTVALSMVTVTRVA